MKTENEDANRSVEQVDRKSTRLNSSHDQISYAVFCLKKKKNQQSHGLSSTLLIPPGIKSMTLFNFILRQASRHTLSHILATYATHILLRPSHTPHLPT